MSTDGTADELAIRNKLAELMWHADNAVVDDLHGYVACFTADAEWEMRGDVRRGHAEILEGAKERRRAGTMGPGSKVAHLLSATMVDFVDADVAQVKSYVQAYRDADTTPTLFVMGQYHDEFRRTPDGWKLSRRIVDFSWS
jgi:3-phenylpropionate/cinnamic acid dioxygenase small subunit